MPHYKSPKDVNVSFGFGSKYFEDETEDDPKNADDELSWRLDPEESFSDWTLLIKKTNDENYSKTYNVHKNILAVGPRCGDFFVESFLRKKTMSFSSSEIHLEDSAAESFPYMLDYMYGKELEVGMENAVALRYLAKYFGIRSMFAEATEFILLCMQQPKREDVNCEGILTLLTEAGLYNDVKLEESLRDFCARNIASLDHDEIRGLPVGSFESIISSDKLQCESSTLSQIVCTFCESRSEEITSDILLNLTNKSFMPIIAPDVALPLLKLSLNNIDDYKCVLDEECTLQNRCIETISNCWEDQLVAPFLNKNESSDKAEEDSSGKKYTVRLCDEVAKHRELPYPVQVKLLEEALCVAKTKMERMEESLDSGEKKSEVDVFWKNVKTKKKNKRKKKIPDAAMSFGPYHY